MTEGIEGLDNGAEPAYPVRTDKNGHYWGMTKREAFVKAAMQANLSNAALLSNLAKGRKTVPEIMRDVAEASIIAADAHLAELEKAKP